MARGDGRVFLRGKTFWISFMHDGKEYRESAETSDQKKAEKFLQTRRDERGADRRGVEVFTTGGMKKITIHELLEALKADFRQRGKATAQNLSVITQADNAKIADRELGKFRALELRPAHINAFIEGRLACGYANATINRILGIVKQAFQLAIDEETLSRMPHIKHLSESDNVRQGFCDAATFARVRDNLPETLRDFAQFGFSTGWRKGEIASLDWDNVQDDDAMIRLRPEQSKNDKGRSVPVSGELIDVIKRRRKAIAYQSDGVTAFSKLVFHRDGVAVTEFRKSWHTACKIAGVPKLLFHDLRRSAVTAMTQAGVPQLVAMGISGHETASMFKRYNIRVEDQLRDAMAATEAYHAAQLAKSAQQSNVRTMSGSK